MGGFVGLLAIIAIGGLIVYKIKNRGQRQQTLAFSDLAGSGGGASAPGGISSPARRTGSSAGLRQPLAGSDGTRSETSSRGGLLHVHSGGLLDESFSLLPTGLGQQRAGSLNSSFSSAGAVARGAVAAAARRRAADNSLGGANSSFSSAAPSDIQIQVRRGTLSDAGAPLQPVAPEGVVLRMQHNSSAGGNLLSDEPSDCSFSPVPPPTSHYSVPGDGSLL